MLFVFLVVFHNSERQTGGAHRHCQLCGHSVENYAQLGVDPVFRVCCPVLLATWPNLRGRLLRLPYIDQS